MTAPETIVAAVLAAGLSRRLGRDKLMEPLDGRPLGAHIADTLAAVPVRTRLAVCPAGDGERAAIYAGGFEIVLNDDPAEGMGRSIGLAAQRAMALGADGLLICLADMPFVPATHLLALIAAGGPGIAVASEANGVRSPPALFGRRLLPELAGLSGDRGPRELLRAGVAIALDPALAADFDTEADFARRR